jgi:hypothetical protein
VPVNALPRDNHKIVQQLLLGCVRPSLRLWPHLLKILCVRLRMKGCHTLHHVRPLYFTDSLILRQCTAADRESETLISDESRPHSPVISILDNPTNQLRKRRVRPYRINSDDSSSDGSAEDEYPNEYPYENEDFCLLDNRTLNDCGDADEDNVKVIQMGTMSWIAFQFLPRFTDQVNAPQSLSAIEALLIRFSPYQEMLDAVSDDEYQCILDGLKTEWRWGMNIVSLISIVTQINAQTFVLSLCS